MKLNLDDMMRQKGEATQLLKKYIEKYGSIDDGDGNHSTLAATPT